MTGPSSGAMHIRCVRAFRGAQVHCVKTNERQLAEEADLQISRTPRRALVKTGVCATVVVETM